MILLLRENLTQVPFKNYASFVKYITKIDGAAINDTEYLGLVMLMYNLLEYSSYYSGTIGSLWLYSKDEATNPHNDIVNADAFRSFKYKDKLLGNTVAQPAPNQHNKVLKNATISVLLKYLCNFGDHLKCHWLTGKLNRNLDRGRILKIIMIMLILILSFLPSKTQNYMFLSSLYQQNTIKNYQNFLAKNLKDRYIQMNIKQKVRMKTQQTSTDILLNPAW